MHVGKKEGKVKLVGTSEITAFKLSVEVHDSYKFAAKSYHSMEYHFRSISTWLAGECKR